MTKLKLVMYDFDGTLADTVPFQLKYYTSLCDKYSKLRPEIEPVEFTTCDELKTWVLGSGGNWKKNWERFGFSLDEISVIDKLEYDSFVANNPFELVKGMEDLVKTLHSQNIKQAIVSLNRCEIINKILNYHSFESFFTHVIGGYTFPTEKPHPQGLLHVMAESGAEPSTSLYIGDTRIDIEAARRAGVKSCAITTGFESREVLKTANPTLIVDSAEEVYAYIQSLR